MTKDLTLRI